MVFGSIITAILESRRINRAKRTLMGLIEGVKVPFQEVQGSDGRRWAITTASGLVKLTVYTDCEDGAQFAYLEVSLPNRWPDSPAKRTWRDKSNEWGPWWIEILEQAEKWAVQYGHQPLTRSA